MKKSLFETRQAIVIDVPEIKVTDEGLELALEELDYLVELGYKVSPEDFIKLSKHATLHGRENDYISPSKVIEAYEPGVEALPMYVDFPKQVKEMTEAEFRFNQVAHYMSTYGVEYQINKVDIQTQKVDEDYKYVTKGMLPNQESFIDRIYDGKLLKNRTVKLISEDELLDFINDQYLLRKERLTDDELKVARFAIDNGLVPKDIPFKENLVTLLVDSIMEIEADKANRPAQYNKFFETYLMLFKHTGDVLELLEAVIVKNNYKHLSTSFKKSFVKTLNSFSDVNFSENLAEYRWSTNFLSKGARKRSRNAAISIIDYLSYNRFSKDINKIKIVASLKNGELTSFNQLVESAYETNDIKNVIDVLKLRPGVYFRHINRLIKNGANPVDIIVSLDAKELKTQTIVSALNNYGIKDDEDISPAIKKLVIETFKALLKVKLASIDTGALANSKVFFDNQDYNLDYSSFAFNNSNDNKVLENDGMAYNIPEDVNAVRFFTYWNDKKRIDIDLHTSVKFKDGSTSSIGWNSRYNSYGITTSGDITHSDAAEYIEIKLDKAVESGVAYLIPKIHSYTGVPFSNIDTLFAGMMAVKNTDEAELYNAENVFFRNDLNSNMDMINYAYIDTSKRILKIGDALESNLTIQEYLDILFLLHNVKVVDNKDEADFVISVNDGDSDIKLSELNYYLDL